MALGDRLDDGQAQATAGGLAAGHAVEAVEHAFAFVRRDAGAAVFHLHRHRAGAAEHRDVDGAPARGVLDRVVDQVAQQDLQRVGLAFDAGRVSLLQAQVDALGSGHARQVGGRAARQVGQVHRPGLGSRAFGGGGLLPRQDQELFNQARSAVDAGRQAAHCHLARFWRIGAVQALCLQAQGRERRAQFVRGIGHEMLLGLERSAHAAKQQVQFLHQRAHFVGQAGIGNRRQIVGLARRHLRAHARHRLQRATDDPPHDQHQDGHHDRDGAQCAQGQVAGHIAAHGQVLRDLHGLIRGLDREHAVGRAVGAHVGKAQHGTLRQTCTRDAVEHLGAVRGPHLHHHVVVAASAFGFLPRARFVVRQRCARAQRQGHLLHVVVEDLVGVVQRGAVGDRRLRHRRDRDRREQEPEQAPAQRVRHFHAFGTM